MFLLLKNILFTLLIPGSVAVYIPLWLAGNPIEAAGHGHFVTVTAAAFILLSGTAIYLWCLWDFARFGRGTPAPIDAPKRLVVRGLYRYVRNPMYLGVLTVIGGWALLFRSHFIVIYGVLVWCCFHLFVVLIEEPMLKRRFGDSYAGYCEQVGRWIPGRGTWSSQ